MPSKTTNIEHWSPSNKAKLEEYFKALVKDSLSKVPTDQQHIKEVHSTLFPSTLFRNFQKNYKNAAIVFNNVQNQVQSKKGKSTWYITCTMSNTALILL